MIFSCLNQTVAKWGRSLFPALALVFGGIIHSHAGLRAPEPTEPLPQSNTIVFHPHLAWNPGSPQSKVARYRVEIATDAGFQSLVDQDALAAVVHWYVTEKRLAPGEYFWRVRAEASEGAPGDWSATRSFQINAPAKVYSLTPSTSTKEIQRIGKEAAQAGGALISFQPGEYRLDLGPNEPLFRWRGASQIIIEGNGATLVRNPSAPLVDLAQCRQILIGNLALSDDPFAMSYVTVLGADPQGGTLEAEILDGFDGVNYPWEVNQFFCYAVDPENPLKKHPNRAGHTYLAWGKTEDLGAKKRRFHVAADPEKGSLKAMRPGDKLIVAYRRWPLNHIRQCEDITFYHFGGGMTEEALFMGGGNKDMKFLGLSNPSLKGIFPGASGWVTGNDRRGPWIEGCSWTANSDDVLDITGNAYLVHQIFSPTEFRIKTGPSYQNPVWQAGDAVLFWNSNTGIPLVETRVTATTEEKGGVIRITVADPIADVVPIPDNAPPDGLTGTHVYNLSCQNPQTVIRNNSFHGGRRFGVNLKAIDAWVENNHFEDLASSAVYLENEPTGWEGLLNRNLVIENNTIRHCGGDLASQRYPRAGIHVNLWHNPPLKETPWRGNGPLVIRNNTIIDRQGIAIGVDNAADVLISGNTISNSSPTESLVKEPALNAAIRVFPNTTRITLKDNRITAKDPAQAAVLEEQATPEPTLKPLQPLQPQ